VLPVGCGIEVVVAAASKEKDCSVAERESAMVTLEVWRDVNRVTSVTKTARFIFL
jgi:hypothetical protein